MYSRKKNSLQEGIMESNVGSADRIVRVVIGLALLSLLFLLNGNARWLGLIGVVPLVTAAFRFCPLYRLVGLNTCPLTAKK
jgi:hypothetical protein